jgi:signal transduction histidine kinase
MVGLGGFIRFLLSMALAWSCAETGARGTQPVLEASTMPASVALTDFAAVLEDPGAALTLQDVIQASTAETFVAPHRQGDELNFGYTRSAYWLRFGVRNSSSESLQRMLTVSRSGLSHVEMHQQQSDGSFHTIVTGEALDFSTRAYPSRMFVFPLTLAAGAEHTIYLRVQSRNTMIIPALLWEPLAFHAYEREDYVGFAWYFGIATGMVVFNLLLFVALHDSIYLLYVMFVSAYALSLAAGNGLAQQFIWPRTIAWPETAVGIGFQLGLVAFLLFARRILNTHQLFPRLHQMFAGLMGVALLLLVGMVFSYESWMERSIHYQMLMAPLLMAVAIYCATKGQRSAVFFLGAFTALVIGSGATALRSLGLVPANALTINGAQIGSALEMLLLAFALADRFNQIRREKTRAQTEALASEQRVVEALRTSERQLEGRVAERTSTLSATIERLQQTQKELVHAEKLASLGALVAGVAHELNTPIGNALTVATTLEEKARELGAVLERGEMRKSTLIDFVGNALAMTELISRSAHRASALIGSFKQVAVDQTSEQRRTFNLRMAVEDNVAALKPNFRHASHQIDVEVPHGITCDSYPGPLGQVIVNLVQNAMTHAFTGRAEGRLRIGASLEQGTVHLSFEDDGIGMEADVLERIFEPFFTTRLGLGGSGLGLSISQNIVAGVLGGTLLARSKAGLGSCFEVRFPLHAPN